MSKKYFAKYLPEKGEIKEGDFVKRSDGRVHKVKELTLLIIEPHDIRMKLFLCSRDIQVGDKFNSANGTGFVCTRVDDDNIYSIGGLYHDFEEVAHRRRYSYKIIGEISPDALWVKEGDEFDEEDVQKAIWTAEDEMTGKKDMVPVHTDKWFTRKYIRDRDEWVTIPPEERVLLIKGPCSHFH